MDHTVGNDALLEINRMELRSGRNLVKHAADSAELDGTSATSKENAPTPRRKSVNIKKSIGKEKENEAPGTSTTSKENVPTTRRKSVSIKKSIGKEKENEEPGTSTTSKENVPTPRRKSVNIKKSIGKEKENEEPDDSRSRKSTQRKRKSKLEEENEAAAETSALEDNAQTPNRTLGLSQTKKRRKTMQILQEHPGTSTTSKENMHTPTRKSINVRSCLGKEKENEEPATACISAEESPGRKSSQAKLNRRKSMWDEETVVGTPTTSKENVQTSTRKSINIKKSVGKEKETEEPAVTCGLIEESPGIKSSQRKLNKRKSKLEQEIEVAETSPLVENAQSPHRRSSQMKKRRKSMQILEEQPKFSDIVQPSQESEISSSLVIENVEKNEISASPSDQNEDDVAEILNSTFEVVEDDSILETPAHKRLVRFADKVETRRQSSCMDSSPKFSTPVSLSSKQRSSQHKGTPHPSAKKRPASILKNSSSKKFPSSSKDKSLRATGSVRKMPDFNSIHKAQFEKMESIVDFSHRRHKCVRKLETQAADDGDKQMQLKPSAIVKPMEQKTGNALSRIPVAPQNTSRSGTPRALSSSHIPLAGFRVLTEKNFDVSRSTPHTVNSRPSLKNVDARRSTPHTVNARPSLKNVGAPRSTPHTVNSRPSLKNVDARRSTPQAIKSRPSLTKIANNSRPKPVNNTKPQRITYEQAKATIQNKNPFTAVSREAARLENRNLLKGVRLNRRFELQMQHRKINV